MNLYTSLYPVAEMVVRCLLCGVILTFVDILNFDGPLYLVAMASEERRQQEVEAASYFGRLP